MVTVMAIEVMVMVRGGGDCDNGGDCDIVCDDGDGDGGDAGNGDCDSG